MFMDLFGWEMCVNTYTLNGDILFVQGYSCRKENLHFNPKDSTMEPRLFQNMQIVATSTPTSCWCHHCVYMWII
jgi:hypothetical protein